MKSFKTLKKCICRIWHAWNQNKNIVQLMKELTDLQEKVREQPFCYLYSIKARALIHAHLLRMDLPKDTLLKGETLFPVFFVYSTWNLPKNYLAWYDVSRFYWFNLALRIASRLWLVLECGQNENIYFFLKLEKLFKAFTRKTTYSNFGYKKHNLLFKLN